jgi:hypothetical protein
MYGRKAFPCYVLPMRFQTCFQIITDYKTQWCSVMKEIKQVSLKHDFNMRNNNCQMRLMDPLIRLNV